jgi:hypothetical protein
VRVEALLAELPKASLGLAFDFGNRCPHAIRIALQNARVVATWASGASVELTLFDPGSHVHTPVLDARAQGTELLEYRAPPSAPPGPAQTICVDVSHVAAALEPPPSAPPICLTRRGTFANLRTIVGHTKINEEAWQRFKVHGLFEIGFAANYVDLHGVTLSGSTSSGQSFRFDASPLRGVATYALDLRLLPWVGGPFYVGGMVELGLGAASANVPFVVAGTPTRSDSLFGDIAIGAVGGIVAHRSGSLRFRFDVTAGVRVVGGDLSPPGCVEDTCEWDTFDLRPLIEPRLVLDAWTSPWFSFSGWVDADALYLPSFGVGLTATIHTWGYDGAP